MNKKKYIWDNERVMTRDLCNGEFVIEEVFRWRNKKDKQFAWSCCWYPQGDDEWVKNDYGGYTRKSSLEEYGEDDIRAIWAYVFASRLTKLKWKIQNILGCSS